MRVVGTLVLSILLASNAFSAPKRVSPTPIPDDASHVCVEAESGLVVAEKNAATPRAPASMVKMMLMLLVAEGLEQSGWTLDKEITITPHAQGMGGSQIWLKKGDVHTLGKLMAAIAVASANDAAVAVAEGLWGSEAAYLERANARAAELGMTQTVFRTPHGLPARGNEKTDQSTAYDMALLARACVRHPDILEWTSQKQFAYGPKNLVKNNTNKLLFRMEDCDGLKTGWTGPAGYCVTATAQRNDVRLVVVVMGCPNNKNRFDTAQRLLEEGFTDVRRLHVVNKGDLFGEPLPLPILAPLGVQLAAGEDVWVTVRASDVDKIEVRASAPKKMPRKARPGDAVGEVHVVVAGQVLASAPLRLPRNLMAAVQRMDTARQ